MELLNYLFQTISAIITIINYFESRIKFEQYNKKDRIRGICFWALVFVIPFSGLSILYNICYIGDNLLSFYSVTVFIFSIIVFIKYAIKAKEYLEYPITFPPKKFWQVFYNKIPSHLNNCKQTQYKFLVLLMDDTEEVKKTSKDIEKKYNTKKSDVSVRTKKVEYDSRGGEYENYPELIKKDNDNEKESQGEECGLIFLLGEECNRRKEQVLRIMDSYAKDLPLPMAYITLGKCEILLNRYYKIDEVDSLKCANLLIMRSYKRSEEWIRLCHYMHTWIIWSVTIAIILFIGLFTNSLYFIRLTKENYSLRDSMQTLSYKDKGFVWSTPPIQLDTLKRDVIEKMKEDERFRDLIEKPTEIFFSEIQPKHVKIWLYDDNKKELVCINHKEEDQVQPQKTESIVGGVASAAREKAEGFFLLWPGHENNRMGKNIKLAWNYKSEPYTTEFESTKVVIKNFRKRSDSDLRIEWHNSSKKTESGKLAFFCYSYDGQLVVELDFEMDNINERNNRFLSYLINCTFHKQVRQYTCLIASIIKSRMAQE